MENKTEEWILKWFDNVMKPKCEKCGERLSAYPYYTDHYEIRHCKNCGHTNKKRRVRQ